MKKYLAAGVLVSLFSTITSVSAYVCADISVNLTRGAESSSVYKLQGFLVEKGLLKAKPNGYFGPVTFSAVKSYQKSVGISPTGSVYTLTRASIKKDSCTGVSSTVTVAPAVLSVATTSKPTTATTAAAVLVPAKPVATTTIPQQVTVSAPVPRPSIDSIDIATFITGGSMKAPLVIRGSNFSTTTTNSIILKLLQSNRVFDIGMYSSATGSVITATSGIPTMLVSCGGSCAEKLPVGTYEVIVKNKGGESNAGYISIKGFTTSSQTAVTNTAISQKATHVKLGTISFSTSVPLQIQNIIIKPVSVSYGTSSSASISPDSINGISLKDELTGEVRSNSAFFATSTAELYENQSKIFTIYANVDSKLPGAVSIQASIVLKDYIARNTITVPVDPFLVTVSY